MVDLFGGAIKARLPDGWLDASDARPVPDHQEVWLERDGNERSMVIELLELADVDNASCATFHFNEIASGNDASGSTVLGTGTLPSTALDPSLRAVAAFTAEGVQQLPGGNLLMVWVAVLRLAAQQTDLLVSVNRPTSEAPGHRDVTADAADAALLASVVNSLEVRDWGLFGS